MSKLKVAILGCGAMTRNIHLQVASQSDNVEVTVLVDIDLARARELAEQFNVPFILRDYREITDNVDAAIVALPHHLHAPVALDLLSRNINILVEKPMALKTSECDEMIEAARRTGAVLSVGLDCRFFESSRMVKELLSSEFLGQIFSFDLRQGNIFSWPVASDFMFRKEMAGGGVLMDIGPHILDLVLWWLGDYEDIEYYDDAMGGVDANCELHLKMRCGASGILELSRTRNLRNTWIFRGERGTLELGFGPNPLAHLILKDKEVTLTGRLARDLVAEETMLDAFHRQFDDFVNAILGHGESFVPGEEAKRSIELIEACYSSRRLLKQPWIFPEVSEKSMLENQLT